MSSFSTINPDSLVHNDPYGEPLDSLFLPDLAAALVVIKKEPLNDSNFFEALQRNHGLQPHSKSRCNHEGRAMQHVCAYVPIVKPHWRPGSAPQAET